MLILCSKNQSFIFVTRQKHACLISTTTTTELALMYLNHTWIKFKHAQTCLYYDQITWLPLSCAVKSFQQLHSPWPICLT